ncbi:MAG: RNA 2',3'-cyclic phosphodiesterase [Pseudomonadota bacterium]
MIRLFWGVPCPPLPAVRTLQDELGRFETSGTSGLAVVPEDNLHITLRYVGAVREPDLPAVRDCVRPLVAAFAAMPLDLRGVGRFARALWVNVDAPPLLYQMVRRIDTVVGEAGFPADPKPFRPHVTVARLSRGVTIPAGEWEERHEDHLFGVIPVDTVHLYRSDTGPQGSAYTPVASIPLRRG